MGRAALLLTALLLCACAARAEGGAPSQVPPDDSIVGEWELVSGTAGGGALPQPPGARATLTVDGDRAGGTSFCNTYSGGYGTEGASVRFDERAVTEMGCEPAVMAAETAFLAALGAVTAFARDGADLLLSGDGVDLRFRPVPAVPTSALAGTDWVLETVLTGEVAGSAAGGSTLRLADDGTVTGRTACSTLAGRWQPTGDRVLFPELRTEPAACPEEARGQDAHEREVLAGGAAVTVEQDRLTLLADDGRGLVYRARA